MLKTFTAFLLLAASHAAVPRYDLHVPFDANNTLAFYAKGDPYNFRHRYVNGPPYETAPVTDGLIMDGTFQCEAEKVHVIHDCLCDLELCNNGLTLAIWFKPQVPWQSGSSWESVVSMGSSPDTYFGVKLALRRRILQPMALERTREIKYECTIPDDIPSGGWMHVALKRNTVDGPLITFVNGVKLECSGGDVNEHEPIEETINNIMIGANDHYEERFHGTVDDFRFFKTPLEIAQIRDIYELGRERADILNAGGNPDE